MSSHIKTGQLEKHDYSAGIFRARRVKKDTSSERLQPSTRLLHSAKLSIKVEGEIKIFHNKNRVREFMIIKPDLQEDTGKNSLV